jgi:glycosyltransferase involved in cell wall biosynthesis
MKFSLIVATCGRREEVVALLESLCRQTHRDFEVLVVDQNAPAFLQEVHDSFRLRVPGLAWECVDYKAANRARLHGLSHASGDVVTFVDDDCEYRSDTLSTVAALFDAHPQVSVFTGKSVDKTSGNDSMSVWPAHACGVGLGNVLSLSLEFTTFFRSATLAQESLDERFGPGTRFASREGPDLLLRLHYRGFRIRYDPAISLFHPSKFTRIDDPAFIARTKAYELGFGALLAKHLALRRSPAAIVMLFYRVFLEGGLGLIKNLLLLRLPKLRFWMLLLRHRFMGFAEYRSKT